MSEQPAKPRSKRMVAWLVIAPIVLLLLALVGANWRAFHLAYCKHLLNSDEPVDRLKGLRLLGQVHFAKGMSERQLEERASPFIFRREKGPGAEAEVCCVIITREGPTVGTEGLKAYMKGGQCVRLTTFVSGRHGEGIIEADVDLLR